VALRLQAMADGLLDAALLARYENFLRPEDKRWPDWSRGQMKKIDGVLDQLEGETKSLKGKLTLGSISVVCALGYLDFRFAANDWRGSRPKLAKWFATVSKTPSVKATVPPPA
jgi:glutathione S-transferase